MPGLFVLRTKRLRYTFYVQPSSTRLVRNCGRELGRCEAVYTSIIRIIMSESLTLELIKPASAPGSVEGFRNLWAYYVAGFDPRHHCQDCLVGKRIEEFYDLTKGPAHSILLDQLDRYPYVYICGVATGPISQLGSKNLHFPLKYEMNSVAEIETYNGYVFKATNAVQLDIPKLEDCWHGLGPEYTQCKNFRFGVAYFGDQPAATKP